MRSSLLCVARFRQFSSLAAFCRRRKDILYRSCGYWEKRTSGVRFRISSRNSGWNTALRFQGQCHCAQCPIAEPNPGARFSGRLRREPRYACLFYNCRRDSRVREPGHIWKRTSYGLPRISNERPFLTGASALSGQCPDSIQSPIVPSTQGARRQSPFFPAGPFGFTDSRCL